MKKFSALLGIGVLCMGFGILIACFLPPMFLVCLQAVLLIVAGLLAFQCH